MSQMPQMMQEEQKETEKRLRDNVKWLMTDSATWLKNLKERNRQLNRVSFRVR